MGPLSDQSQWGSDDRFGVALMCADWCRVCQGFATEWAAWSPALMDSRIEGKVWIDLEATVPVLADLDVETLPTLAVIRWQPQKLAGLGCGYKEVENGQDGVTLLNLAPVPPSMPVIERITLSCLSEVNLMQPIQTQPELSLADQRACAGSILALFLANTSPGSRQNAAS